MAIIETTGRGRNTSMYGQDDLEAFFERSGILGRPHLEHTPFLAFQEIGDRIVVNIVSSAMKLATDYPPETKVMVQWPGRWRSDFFQMTVGDVRAELERRGALRIRRTEEVESIDLSAFTDLPGRCTDCQRRTGGEEIGNPCRMRIPRGGHCRGRIIPST